MTPRRRLLAAIAATALLAPLPAIAQAPARRARIGFLGLSSPEAIASRVAALRAGLRELGYVEGRNLSIEFRWAEGDYRRLPALAAELVNLRVDVIVAHGTPGARAAKQATSTVPIVMAGVADAVRTGLVASLAYPGGNVTGPTYFGAELNAKRLDLVKDALPHARRVGVLYNSDNAWSPSVLALMDVAARALKLELLKIFVTSPGDLDRAFASLVEKKADAVVVVDDGMLNAHVASIAERASRIRLPTIGILELADAGGLLAYGADVPEQFRRAATYVDRILKGEKPADLPVERMTRFKLVINGKTAQAIGVDLPRSLLELADPVVK
jgi:putative ABC transport system substrate-binding protein